jgi:MFS family permease
VTSRETSDIHHSLWRNHDFMVLWTSQTVSALGSSMSFFVFPLVGLALTGSLIQAAFAGTAFTLGSVASRLPAGVLVDRWNRRKVLFASSAAGAALYASLALAMLGDSLSIGHLVVVAFASGVVSSFFLPAETASLRRVVPTEELPTAFSHNQARRHVADLAGAPLGGILYGLGRAFPFLFDSVTYALSAVAITRMRTPLPAPRRDHAESSTMVRDIGEGLRFMLSHEFFRAFLAFAALANFASKALFLVLILKLASAGVSPAMIGAIDAAGGLAGIVGAFCAPWLIRRIPNGWLAIVGGLVSAVVLIPIAYTNDPFLIGGLIGLVLLINPAANASVASYLTAVTPDRFQGRTGASLSFCVTLLMPLGPLTGGWLLHTVGGPDAILITSGLTALAVAPLLLSGEVRRLPTPDRWAIPESDAMATAGILRA